MRESGPRQRLVRVFAAGGTVWILGGTRPAAESGIGNDGIGERIEVRGSLRFEIFGIETSEVTPSADCYQTRKRTILRNK